MIFYYTEIESVDFCGGKRTLCLRGDISNMEAVAIDFERDDDISPEVLKQCRSGEDLSLLLKRFPNTEWEGYSPYCEISFDSDIEDTETLDQIQLPENRSHIHSCLRNGAENVGTKLSEASLSSVASTLCSLRTPAENVYAANVKNHANTSLEEVASSRVRNDTSRNVNESSLAFVKDTQMRMQESSKGLKVNPIVKQNSDEPDTEFFRVKRRFYMRSEQINADDATFTNHDGQGLKRLRKLQPEGKCTQPIPSACLTTANLKRNNTNTIIHTNRNPEIVKDRFGRGTNSVSIKVKKNVSEDSSSKYGEPTPPVNEPTRIKIRGPPFQGLDPILGGQR